MSSIQIGTIYTPHKILRHQLCMCVRLYVIKQILNIVYKCVYIGEFLSLHFVENESTLSNRNETQQCLVSKLWFQESVYCGLYMQPVLEITLLYISATGCEVKTEQNVLLCIYSWLNTLKCRECTVIKILHAKTNSITSLTKFISCLYVISKQLFYCIKLHCMIRITNSSFVWKKLYM